MAVRFSGSSHGCRWLFDGCFRDPLYSGLPVRWKEMAVPG
jgi:hypothetical protein